MDLPSQMILFARVVETGSFSAAARSLGHTPSAVSRQIGHLEDQIGLRLLHRSQNGIVLTGEGEAFHERCRTVAEEVHAAEELLAGLGEVRGTLRVVSTVAFGKAQLLPVLPAFLEAYPDLRMDLELTDRHVDLATDQVDVAIRFGEQIDDPDAITRKLLPNERVICAAPSYIERYGRPETPADLVHHNCLGLTTVSSWNDWVFGPDSEQTLHVDGNLRANSADAIYHAALAGLGVARLSTYLIDNDLQSGRLVRLLPDYVQEAGSITAIFANRRNLAPKTRVFIDYLAERFVGRANPHTWEAMPDTKTPVKQKTT
ncbi:LysR family transcriptional regulator [Rhodovibrio salinarum]|uniref:LysR family transcriptional regulator n=1 Tax=Rhodovibrio salinarum TaxID=1087 RepID=A0A934V101_9PROT|nr:LysR family transcriptional regulator [Rhodovibrio salinarum]MBK1698186.1 LysR family transcriptional regulator [Rhodovibrio salinarum]